ncbi:hypothetical protein F4805DRAFT_432459 [Annulohypoxylon moriforme]|nr:hypothetical protein F4805DRAFT_432459 [Annulohypoxylon moriforme]
MASSKFPCCSKLVGLDSERYKPPASNVSKAIEENPRSRSSTFLSAQICSQKPARLVILAEKTWKAGSVLKIGFQKGDKFKENQVKMHASEWCRYANLDFNFIGSKELGFEDLDILISFNPYDGPWSYIGTECAKYARENKPSMNLGFVQSDPEKDIRSSILHEFGHALAMVHEHQSPYSQINWNKKRVLLSGGFNPENNEAHWNVFHRYTLQEVKATAFDPDSIMLYSYPASWTEDGKGTKSNTELSDVDKAYASFWYPFDDTYARHCTLETRLPNELQPDEGRVIYYQKKYEIEPEILIGLTSLEIAKGSNVSIDASVSEATTEWFRTTLKSRGDTKLYTASMIYLEKGPHFDYLQTGVSNIMKIHSLDQPHLTQSKRINFAKPFQSSPMVVTWLKSLELEKSRAWRIKVYPSDIDRDGFTIHAESDSALYSADVTWLAYPADHPGVTSDKFNTMDMKSPCIPQDEISGIFTFPTAFPKTPKVIVALDSFDFDHSKDLCLKLNTSVTSTGIHWNLQSGRDSIMYSSGASFFAWI